MRQRSRDRRFRGEDAGVSMIRLDVKGRKGRPGFAITERLRVLVCSWCSEVIDCVSDLLGQRRLPVLASWDDWHLLGH